MELYKSLPCLKAELASREGLNGVYPRTSTPTCKVPGAYDKSSGMASFSGCGEREQRYCAVANCSVIPRLSIALAALILTAVEMLLN